MAKILLVEDDNNLREIYSARLEAEGYEIFSASDGEEALAIAVKQRPDLIISDVMMPKISGFDMLDILRSTPETKDVKVIVMTALSQEEDRQRGEQLGADRYLVKSQVTLDDVVSMTRELLESTSPVATNSSFAQNTGASQQAPDTNLVADPQAPNQADGENPTNLDEEVRQFVNNSPLMNGTAPTPDQSQQQPPAAI